MIVGIDIKAEELEELEKSYLKYKEVYKLELLVDDVEFFRRYMLEGSEYPNKILTPSQNRLRKAKLSKAQIDVLRILLESTIFLEKIKLLVLLPIKSIQISWYSHRI